MASSGFPVSTINSPTLQYKKPYWVNGQLLGIQYELDKLLLQ